MDPRQQQPNQPQAPSTQPAVTSEQPAVNPQSPTVAPPDPQFIPPTSVVATETPRKSYKKLGLWLVITPSALIILGVIIFLIVIAMPENAASSSDLFGEVSPVKQALNVAGFISVGLGIITWLPGIIVGIILLARKK